MKLRLVTTTALAATALCFASALHAFEPASDADKTFVGKVSQGGLYEVEASKVAAIKAVMPDVKDLANTEVHDHSLVNQGLKKIAVQTGIPVSPTLNATFQQRLAKLKGTASADFDAAYIADMEQIHDADEKLFAQEATQGSDSFKTFAHKTDLIVKRHIGGLHS